MFDSKILALDQDCALLRFPPMVSSAHFYNLEHQRFWLLPEKAIYWQKRDMLLVADLHIGKSTHFRKHGIAVPNEVEKSNLDKLDVILKQTEPEHLIILGDLFHSNINKEWQQFITWRKNHPLLEVSLVVGNHDILDTQRYHTGSINLFKKMTLDPFLLIHDSNELSNADKTDHYILSGHIHPAVQLNGRGRQAMKLPCFYFGKDNGILPAFGEFTGTHIIEPKEEDRIFMIVDSQIMPADN